MVQFWRVFHHKVVALKKIEFVIFHNVIIRISQSMTGMQRRKWVVDLLYVLEKIKGNKQKGKIWKGVEQDHDFFMP